MLNFNFNPFPVLETSRLVLRRIIPEDADILFVMRSDKETMKFIPRPVAQQKKDVLELIEKMNEGIEKNETINWGIVLKESNTFIGTIGYVRAKPENHRAEVGYMIDKKKSGKGYATEALKEVINYGFNKMKLHSIEAVIDPVNYASEKILQKCDFVKEAHFKENAFWEGKYLDSVIYTLISE